MVAGWSRAAITCACRAFVLALSLSLLTRPAAALETQLVSPNGAETASGNAPSTPVAISANGRLVVFTSTASDLVANDTNGVTDVFVRDTLTSETQLVSINAAGTASGAGESAGPIRAPLLSGDGHTIGFESCAPDLVDLPLPAPTNIFVRDLTAAVTTLVSVNSSGTAGGNSGSAYPALSRDGSIVAFQSNSSDLVDLATNGTTNVFVRNLNAGRTGLVSINLAGTASGDGGSVAPLLSGDGHIVVFISFSSDLTPLHTGARNLFARDLRLGVTSLVNVNVAGDDGGNANANNPTMSSDGRFVAFESMASDLVDNDLNGFTDVFVRDLGTSTTTLVSVNQTGTASGSGASQDAVISANGRYVAFVSFADDLVERDGNGTRDVFVRDLVAHTTSLISVNIDGTSGGNDASTAPSISADGRFVAFSSFANDLVANDRNQAEDIFVRDRIMNTTTLVTPNAAGTGSANLDSSNPLLSASGQSVVFNSLARDLVADFVDGNNVFEPDVFVWNANAPFPCTGDCNGDGRVTVDELVTGVNIALANATVESCVAFDPNVDGKVTVDELVQAVNNALDGCRAS